LSVALASPPGLLGDLILRQLAAEPGLSAIGRATDEEELDSLLSKRRPKILVMDTECVGTRWIQAVSRLRRQAPEMRVLVLAGDRDARQVERALRAGASGLISWSLDFGMLVKAIRTVAAGQIWAERAAVGHVLATLASSPRPAAADGLTLRERQIGDCVARGLRNKEIAKQLSLSEKTVKNHLCAIFRKLKVESRMALGLYALRRRSPDW
jgi:two-component system nitrate/nitrite response regulator NarL